MKRRRNLGMFLLAVSLLIPWNVAYLHYDYYAEADFLVRKHLSQGEEDGLQSLFKENSRVLVPPGPHIHQPVISSLPVISCQPIGLLPADPEHPILRC